jgi:Predicted membrane protein (DUF2232)
MSGLPPGRRARPGVLALALAYLLLAPPGFLLGPLAGLLALSRPTTFREWAWLGLAAGWMCVWLVPAGNLMDQLLRATAVLTTGGFLAITLVGRAPAFRRGLASLGFATAALVLWASAFHLAWSDLKAVIGRDAARSLSALASQAATAGSDETAELLRQMASSAPSMAMLTPALVFLSGLLGTLLAWNLYQSIAVRAMGDPPAPFPSFRFSDQMVWLPVAGLALVLFPPVPALGEAGANLLLVAVGLYAARGLAVVGAGAGRVPRLTTTFVALVAFFLLPFVVGGLTLLGLADTWLDFRGRPASSGTGGFDR